MGMWWMQQPYQDLLLLSTRLLVAPLVCTSLAVVLLLTSFAPASAVFAALAVASAATGWLDRPRASRTGKPSSRWRSARCRSRRRSVSLRYVTAK